MVLLFLHHLVDISSYFFHLRLIDISYGGLGLLTVLGRHAHEEPSFPSSSSARIFIHLFSSVIGEPDWGTIEILPKELVSCVLVQEVFGVKD
jgi:hypothetical protein